MDHAQKSDRHPFTEILQSPVSFLTNLRGFCLGSGQIWFTGRAIVDNLSTHHHAAQQLTNHLVAIALQILLNLRAWVW
jgi:hypothetical protein